MLHSVILSKGRTNRRKIGAERGTIEMKFVKIIFHSIFNEAILDMMKRLSIHEFVDCQRICAEDEDGRHFGDRHWPDTDCILSAPVSDEKAAELFDEIVRFKQTDPRRKHVRILILPVERVG
jgi:hypothetical protein